MNKKHEINNFIAKQKKDIKDLEDSNKKFVARIERLVQQRDNLKTEINRLQDEINRLTAIINEPFSPFWIGEQMAKDDEKIRKLQ